MAANEARRLLPSSSRVVVIDREARASFPPSYLWVMTGERRPEAITRQRSRLSRKGIEFVNAEVRQIDVVNRYVRAEGREFYYDYLVVALGAETTLETKPGLAETAHSFFSLEAPSASRLTCATSGGRVVIAIAGLPFKCPAAPYEAAMLLEHRFHERRLRQKVEIDLFTPETRPLAVAGNESGEAVTGLLAHKGIGFHPERQLTSVDATSREVRFADGGSAPFDLLIAVPEHRAPAIVRESDLADETGWIPVDQGTLETRHENVFALGDATYIRLPDGMLLPKAGVFAEAQAKVVAKIIAQRSQGGRAPAPFDGRGRCFIEVGAGAAGMADGGFFGAERRIEMKQPSIIWHWAKVALERFWLWHQY